jgi:hypothetical protein
VGQLKLYWFVDAGARFDGRVHAVIGFIPVIVGLFGDPASRDSMATRKALFPGHWCPSASVLPVHPSFSRPIQAAIELGLVIRLEGFAIVISLFHFPKPLQNRSF